MADETDDEIISEVPAGSESVETPDATTEIPASTIPDSGETASSGESKRTALDAVTEAIDGANKPPKRIQAKEDERSQGDTRPRNADGTFKTETAEEKAAREEAEEAARLAKETPEEKAARLAAETPEQKAAREAKEAAAKKAPDHVNDAIPEGLNKRTAERMKYLIDTVKAQEQLTAQHNQLFSAIESTGASPQEFAQMVNYMRAVHSSDPKVLEQAYATLQAELRGLAVKLGRPLYEVNLLREESNADLVEEIREGKITTNRAHEIALMREQQKATTSRTTQQTEAERQTQDAKAANEQGRRELDELDAVLRARDGATFVAKYNLLVPVLKPLFAKLDPRAWKEVFQSHYDNLKLPPAPTTTTTAANGDAPKVKQMPMRPKSPAGAGATTQAPKSALEAISQALDGM